MSRLLGRRPLLPRAVRAVLALLCAFAAVLLFVGQQSRAQEPGGPLAGAGAASGSGGSRAGSPSEVDPALVGAGRTLFVQGCSSCHGMDAKGLPGVAPSLHGVGALAADFYLRTGRMPMADPEDEPRRGESFYNERQIDALVSYVASLGGPPIPSVDASAGDIGEGFSAFTEMCAGCHQVVGQGGLTTQAWVPDLQKSQPIDVAEAVRIGPYVMPKFDGQLSDAQIDSIARYVQYTQRPRGRRRMGHRPHRPDPRGHGVPGCWPARRCC